MHLDSGTRISDLTGSTASLLPRIIEDCVSFFFQGSPHLYKLEECDGGGDRILHAIPKHAASVRNSPSELIAVVSLVETRAQPAMTGLVNLTTILVYFQNFSNERTIEQFHFSVIRISE